ncbi:IS6 family transposase [Gloeocapsopsis dulcis]|uniref:IS6 family transposase n=1 Tax=Gloeocapsopsis dulcis TaxID=2859516 RepID=UPI0018C62252|nr:IS6 family transposase [Gloeocapsopsis dulcis]
MSGFWRMYYRHRFPTEIISYAVWLYFTLPLSYRDVQKLLLYRGIEVSHEAIRAWCQKFGQQSANKIRRRRPQPGAKWYLDEMVIPINGDTSICGEPWMTMEMYSIF